MNDYKEYLEKQSDGTYALVLRGDACKKSDILIPEGANVYARCNIFGDYKLLPYAVDGDWDILWQRDQDEPFLTPECTLNDQYEEKDNVNHPSHYTQGKVECIDALESATIGKSGIEAVCVANVIKYLWRYEDKGGLESILKAKWYLDKLIECKK